MTYFINYHTGAGDEWFEGTLDEAKIKADAEAAFTQQNITIEDEDGNTISTRPWCGVSYDEDDLDMWCEDPIVFGTFGFYSDWWDM